MLEIKSQDGKLSVACTNRGFGVYLDTDSLIDLAKGDGTRRERFVSAIKRKGTLLFSFTNAFELAGPQGRSADAVRSFLDSLEQYWMPLAMNVFKVMQKEQDGGDNSPAFSDSFLDGYFKSRLFQVCDTTDGIVGISDQSFFRLGSIIRWIQENRVALRDDMSGLDEMFRARLDLRVQERLKNFLPEELAALPEYSNKHAARFTFFHLQRVIWNEAKAFHLKKNDGIDFCHAVIASSYGSFITLDNQWKRRVLQIPKPHRLAKVFYRPELDELVNELEVFDP